MSGLVEKTFEALFALEDLREIWRRTAPLHQLTDKEKVEVRAILSRVREILRQIEEGLEET